MNLQMAGPEQAADCVVHAGLPQDVRETSPASVFSLSGLLASFEKITLIMPTSTAALRIKAR
jgi:hypothetical protein